MTSPIPKPPQVLYQALHGAPEPEVVVPIASCVDCALEGAPSSLTAVYTVSGTTLCREHAVAARKVSLSS